MRKILSIHEGDFRIAANIMKIARSRGADNTEIMRYLKKEAFANRRAVAKLYIDYCMLPWESEIEHHRHAI